jgi:hypothetical protein
MILRSSPDDISGPAPVMARSARGGRSSNDVDPRSGHSSIRETLESARNTFYDVVFSTRSTLGEFGVDALRHASAKLSGRTVQRACPALRSRHRIAQKPAIGDSTRRLTESKGAPRSPLTLRNLMRKRIPSNKIETRPLFLPKPNSESPYCPLGQSSDRVSASVPPSQKMIEPTKKRASGPSRKASNAAISSG